GMADAVERQAGDFFDAESGFAGDGREVGCARAGCLGARVLPEVSESPSGLHWGFLECGELGGSGKAVHGGEVVFSRSGNEARGSCEQLREAHGFFFWFCACWVGTSNDLSALDPSAGDEDRLAFRPVVAATLRIDSGRSAEFSCCDDKRV